MAMVVYDRSYTGRTMTRPRRARRMRRKYAGKTTGDLAVVARR
jgi:hypothetical protein